MVVLPSAIAAVMDLLMKFSQAALVSMLEEVLSSPAVFEEDLSAIMDSSSVSSGRRPYWINLSLHSY